MFLWLKFDEIGFKHICMWWKVYMFWYSLYSKKKKEMGQFFTIVFESLKSWINHNNKNYSALELRSNLFIYFFLLLFAICTRCITIEPIAVGPPVYIFNVSCKNVISIKSSNYFDACVQPQNASWKNSHHYCAIPHI